MVIPIADDTHCEILRMIIGIINSYEGTEKKEAAARFVHSCGLTPDVLVSLRRFEANALEPDFEYLELMDTVIDILDV